MSERGKEGEREREMQIVLNPQRVRLSNLCPWAASWVGCREGGALAGAGESCRLQTACLALKLGFSCWNTFTTQPS